MKKMIKLDEKIYDIDLGTGISSTEYIYRKYYNMPNTFMSFTRIDKLGINPKSKYDTPIGIYTYPIKEFFNTWVGIYEADPDSFKSSDIWRRKIGTYAPFAGRNPYVWVVQYQGKQKELLDLQNYSRSDFDLDVDDLIERRLNDFDKVKSIYKIVHKETWNNFSAWLTKNDKSPENDKEVRELLEEYFYSEFKLDASLEANVDTYAGQFWNISRLLSPNPVKWNADLRKLGYECIADFAGEGIIHRNESIQAVFLSAKNMKILDKINNIDASVRISDKEVRDIIDITRSKLDEIIKVIETETLLNTIFNKINRSFSYLTRFYANINLRPKGVDPQLKNALYSKFLDFYDAALESLQHDITYEGFANRLENEMRDTFLYQYPFVSDSWINFIDAILSMYK